MLKNVGCHEFLHSTSIPEIPWFRETLKNYHNISQVITSYHKLSYTLTIIESAYSFVMVCPLIHS